MNSDLVKIFKSFEQRLEEFTYILLMFSPTSAAAADSSSEIASVWANYLELHLPPAGWNAVWYILRQNCADLAINFPRVVGVVVENVNFNALTAQVRIINDDDRGLSDLPEVVSNAPLKDLYVTVDQADTGLDASAIAEYIDQLRLFFHHLWWPWDTETEYGIRNWRGDNLENRLRMYFDKLRGKVHYITGKKIKHLMERGEELHEKMSQYFRKLSSEKESRLDSGAVCQMEKYFKELEFVKAELRKLEVPRLRKIEDDVNSNKSVSSRLLIVVGDGNVEEINSYLQLARSFVEDDGPENRIWAKLEDAFLDYYRNDTIILCPEKNLVVPRKHFDFAVNLIGLPELETSISDTRSHWCLFECLNDVQITNVCFGVQFVRSVITVKRGCVKLDRVRLVANEEILPAAIRVYEEASFLAVNCDFANFDVAVECFGRASVKLDKCSFRNNNVCLKISSESELVIFDCDMTRTNYIPIQIERLEYAERTISPLSYMTR